MTGLSKSSSLRTFLNSRYLPWLLLAGLVGILLLLGSFAYWRSSGVGPQVQVPMFYDAHYLYPRPWTQEQSAPGVPDPAPVSIYGDNSVNQSFIAGSDNLSGVAFLLSAPQDGMVTAVLSDAEGSAWRAEIPLLAGEDRQAYALSFPTFLDSKGKTFNLSLSAPQATAEQPLVVYTVGGDRLGYSLHLNEFIRPGNLTLTTYSKGSPGLWWFDALAEQTLPTVFRLRLQQYKPEQFKGNLFSWLLVITIGLSAALLVLASRRSDPEVTFWQRIARLLGWYLVLFAGFFLVWQVGSGRVQLFSGPENIFAEYSVEEFTNTHTEPRLVADLSGDLWTAVREPEARFVSTDLVQGYPAIRVPDDSRLNYSLTISPETRLRLATAVLGSGVIRFKVKVNDQVLLEEEIAAGDESNLEALSWQELDLSPWVGQGVVLSLVTSSQNGSAQGLWLMPQIITDAPWILSGPPEEYLPLNVRFGETAELLGITLNNSLLQSEGQLTVQLLWEPLQKSDRYGKVFVHLLDENNQLIAQHDAPPVNGAYPFTLWQPGIIIQDEHLLKLDPDSLTSGPYRLEIGVYDPDTLERWPVVGGDGVTIESDAVILELPSEVLP